jgi:hypothetical protein
MLPKPPEKPSPSAQAPHLRLICDPPAGSGPGLLSACERLVRQVLALRELDDWTDTPKEKP